MSVRLEIQLGDDTVLCDAYETLAHAMEYIDGVIAQGQEVRWVSVHDEGATPPWKRAPSMMVSVGEDWRKLQVETATHFLLVPMEQNGAEPVIVTRGYLANQGLPNKMHRAYALPRPTAQYGLGIQEATVIRSCVLQVSNYKIERF